MANGMRKWGMYVYEKIYAHDNAKQVVIVHVMRGETYINKNDQMVNNNNRKYRQ